MRALIDFGGGISTCFDFNALNVCLYSLQIVQRVCFSIRYLQFECLIVVIGSDSSDAMHCPEHYN